MSLTVLLQRKYTDTWATQICTEVLYQPLTLLDCLHTYCGSCLKEWFSCQASQANRSRPDPYTCPSCRASVRETKPNATVTTLLDMYLQANPGKGKSTDEKEELEQKYKHGEDVMPKIGVKRDSSSDVEDRRMVEEIREMSLREVGVRGPGSYERGHRHRRRDGSLGPDHEDTRRRRREQERRRHLDETESTVAVVGTTRRIAEPRAQPRHIEHQSSLRSLLSSSDVDSAEVQAEVLRQITEEGLLDGIDLDNLDVAQEDELSERIADAYRQRHSRTFSSPRAEPEHSRGPSPNTQRPDGARPRHRYQSNPQAEVVGHSSHTPISRHYLGDAYPTGPAQRNRTSSEHRRQASPATAAARAAQETQRQAARSATDLSNQPRTGEYIRDRPTEPGRRTTDPERQRTAGNSRGRSSQLQPISTPSANNLQHFMSSPDARQRLTQALSPQPPPVRNTPRGQPDSIALQPTTAAGETHYPINDLIPQESSGAAPSNRSNSPIRYPEPSLSCHRCGRANIEYDLHFHCPHCSSGNFNTCLRCYRTGKGCFHWFGFGKAAIKRWEREAHSTGAPLPHSLTARQYLRPPPGVVQSTFSSDGHMITSSDPKSRLQSGFFCAGCLAFANDCFWKCDCCNDGEWGFCNFCVNRGKHCTHPLLPVAHPSAISSNASEPRVTHQTAAGHSFTRLTHPNSLSRQANPRAESDEPADFVQLTFSTSCDICKYPIPPSTTRFHCPVCNDGDYDICTQCYLKLVSSGRVSRENGDKGWRRCLQGHRMVILGFEDGLVGQRRVVVRDLVGGHALSEEDHQEANGDSERKPEWRWKEENTVRTLPMQKKHPSTSNASQTFPPSGGTGLRGTAMWSYYPQEGVQDELSFPKGAEITEAVDINGDWFEGFYCGKRGLWPGSYARVIR